MRARKIPFIASLIITAITVTACGGGERREVIQNKGSDTLVNVAQAWAEEYQVVNPAVVVAVSGGGSGTGIAALINGTVDIANASRRWRSTCMAIIRWMKSASINWLKFMVTVAVMRHGPTSASKFPGAKTRKSSW
jgi:hypothetical protein